MQSEKELHFKEQHARAQIKKIKAFYIHLAIFCSVMLIVGAFWVFGYNVCFICFETGNANMNFVGFFPWLIIIIIQGLIAFRKLSFYKRWEERKIKEFMEE